MLLGSFTERQLALEHVLSYLYEVPLGFANIQSGGANIPSLLTFLVGRPLIYTKVVGASFFNQIAIFSVFSNPSQI
jgi:hypothetical protein